MNGGFHKWWYLQNRWFIRENPNPKWMITGGTPIYGNIQMGISPKSEGLAGLDMTHLKWGGHPS